MDIMNQMMDQMATAFSVPQQAASQQRGPAVKSGQQSDDGSRDFGSMMRQKQQEATGKDAPAQKAEGKQPGTVREQVPAEDGTEVPVEQYAIAAAMLLQQVQPGVEYVQLSEDVTEDVPELVTAAVSVADVEVDVLPDVLPRDAVVERFTPVERMELPTEVTFVPEEVQPEAVQETQDVPEIVQEVVAETVVAPEVTAEAAPEAPVETEAPVEVEGPVAAAPSAQATPEAVVAPQQEAAFVERPVEAVEAPQEIATAAESNVVQENVPEAVTVQAAPETVAVQEAAPEVRQTAVATEEISGEQEEETVLPQETPVFGPVDTVPVKVAERPTAPVPLEEPEGVPQLAQRIETVLVTQVEVTHVEITLSPANLGKITVLISHNADGALHIALTANTARATMVLERNTVTLQHLMTNQSRPQVEIEVRSSQEGQPQFLDPNGQNQQEQQRQQQEQQQRQQGENQRQERQAQDFLQQLRLGLVDLSDV